MNANKHEFGKSRESKTMGFKMRSKTFAQKKKEIWNYLLQDAEKTKKRRGAETAESAEEDWSLLWSIKICEKSTILRHWQCRERRNRRGIEGCFDYGDFANYGNFGTSGNFGNYPSCTPRSSVTGTHCSQA
jgi:hypothetical protein